MRAIDKEESSSRRRCLYSTNDRFFFLFALVSAATLTGQIILYEFHQHPHAEQATPNPVKRTNIMILKEKDLVDEGSHEFKASIDMVKTLEDAGEEVDDELRSKLPSVEEVVKLYSSKVHIEGLERCSQFRDNIPPEEAHIGPAGLFNTGTNLLAQLLMKNCYIPARIAKRKRDHGMKWQVPWAKHSPVSWRHFHLAKGETSEKNRNVTNVLPVATIKDPLTWMGSMCRHSYAAKWQHRSDHCPNLVPNDFDRNKLNVETETVPVSVRYNDTHSTHHDSLAHLWNDWYNGYRMADFPRLIIRFEDLMYHPEEVVSTVCTCGGGVMRDGNFTYMLDSAKGSTGAHHGAAGLAAAMIRYGDAEIRVKGFTEDDLSYAREKLDPVLMEKFAYSYP